MFISLGLILPSLLARSLHMYFMCPLFHYAAYAVARAPVEMKKKQDISSFPTYAEKGGPLDKKNIFWIKQIFSPKSSQISPRIGSKDQKLF